MEKAGPDIIRNKILEWQMNTAGLTGYFQGAPTTAYQQQQFEQGMANKQFDRSIFESDRGFKYTAGRDEIEDQKWQTEFDRIKEQDGIQNAIAFANQTLNEAEFEDSSAFRWVGLEEDLKAAALKGEEYEGMSANDVVRNVRDNFTNAAGKIPTDPKTKEAIFLQIVGAGLPEDQEKQAFSAIGLTKEEVASLMSTHVSSGK